MITDLISRLPLYEAVIPGASAIAAAWTAGDPAAAPCEVREKAYAAKPDDQRRFEVHFHTVDLMMIREGAEVIHICPREELAEAEPLADDGLKLDGAIRGSAVIAEAGSFCAILPGEAHAVGGSAAGKPQRVSKWVVKVPCPPALRLD